jgi:membrane-bound metal-dependent hydrolase YbcI (DUF457 family)
MFLGHFAAGLAASRAEPRLRPGTAFLAAQLPDAIWPYLLLAGAETVAIEPGVTAVTPLRFESYPWSHSLAMVLVWAVVAAAVYRFRGGMPRGALLVAALVASHWLLDAASHRPDVPLWPGSDRVVGLGLWYSRPWTLAVELGLFAAGVAVYARGRDVGRGFWILAATLVLVYLGNVFGPPPPSVAAMALSMVVVVPLLWWWGNRVAAAA